jgi:hypothetical protein
VQPGTVLRISKIWLLLLVLPTFGRGQDVTPANADAVSQIEQQIKQLQQQELELQERIRILESKQTSSAAVQASAPVPASSTPVRQEEESSGAPTLSAEAQNSKLENSAVTPLPELHAFRGLQWRGFAEVDYKILNQRVPETGTYGFVPGSSGSFYTGDFDLFLTSRLSEKADLLAELAVEEGDAQSFTVDLRRMLLNYDVSDHMRVSFGRYQTNIGYYNWAFRSAAWLQTTADRPLVMEFASNGGLLPTQAVGVSVTGTIPSGKLGLNYVAEYGSSDTIRPDINGDGLLNDENNGNHVDFGIFLTPDPFPGLRIGASYYHDQISDLVTTDLGVPVQTEGAGTVVPPTTARWNQTIANGHVVYISHGIEFLNEGFLIRFAPTAGTGGGTFNTPSFYSQLSKSVGPVRPFMRFQYTNASPQDLIYNDVGLRYGPSFGARYDLTEYLAFKAQLDDTVRRGLPNLGGLHLQISGTF